MKHACHEVERFRAHLACILLLDRLWLAYVWKLITNKPGIRFKLLLEQWWQFAHNLLDTEELVNLRFSRK